MVVFIKCIKHFSRAIGLDSNQIALFDHCLKLLGDLLVARFAVKCKKKTPTINSESQQRLFSSVGKLVRNVCAEV